jgi:hypothetical protein
MRKIYAHCESEGLVTNLQLHSLRRAACDLKELARLRMEYDDDRVPEQKERLVFILSCLGLSLSQLLGQQWSEERGKVPAMSKLLDEVLSRSSLRGETEQCRLRDKFDDLVTYYDASRHFGKSKHQIVDSLTFEMLDNFVDTTLAVWGLIIAGYRSDSQHDIEEFSIAEEVDLAPLQERKALERQLRELKSGPTPPSDRAEQIARLKGRIAEIDEWISREPCAG